MKTRSTNWKNLGKDGKDLPMENYLIVTATINYIGRKLNQEINFLKIVEKSSYMDFILSNSPSFPLSPFK